MTRNLEITPEAEKDIQSITLNILQQDSAQSATKLLNSMKKQFQTLADYPDSGREGGIPGTREVILTGQPYITVYSSNKEKITIVRVLYGGS